MKIKKYLFVALLPVIIGTLFTYYFYLRAEENAFELILDVKRVTLEQIANSITAQFKFVHYDLQDLSQRKGIIELSEAGKEDIDLFYKTHDSVFVSLTRIDRDGYIAYSTPNKNVVGLYVGDQPHNKEVLKKHIPILSDVFTAVQGFKTLAFAYPVFKDGVFDGTITILLPISKLAALLLQTTNLPAYGHSILLTEGGIEIYCTFDEEHIGESILSTAIGDDSFLETIDDMLQGNSGLAYYWEKYGPDSINTKKWLVYRAIPIQNTFWSLGLITTGDEILGKLHEIRANMLIIIVTSLAAFIGLIALYFRISNKADRELKRRDQKYTMVTEQSGHIVYEYDTENNSIVWTGAFEEVLGFNDDEFKKFDVKTWDRNIHPSDKEYFDSVIKRARKDETGYVMEYRIMNKEGDYVYVEDSGILDREEGTGRLKCFGTVKNITERKIAEAALLSHKVELEKLVEERTKKLEEVNRELEDDIKKRKETESELIIAKEKAEVSDRIKSEFLAQVSHEIRTPINTLLSFTGLIRDELSDKVGDDLREGFGIIAASGGRIIRTIDLILNMSELQTKTYEPNITTFNLVEDILTELIEEFKIHTDKKGLELQFLNIPDISKLTISKDRYSVSQIFVNLIDNAIKYTEEGEVKITVHTDTKDKICVEICDTGIGISDEYLPILFDSFSQEEQGYTRKFDGTGLGLALVKNYCAINNATIEVESKKGVGSTFRVTFN
ncbi:MAG: PAS domain-containing protein [Bacteroidetes bacterium]|nr:PAS domain-containing protein [Bacteroidota bacterium]